MAEQKSRKKQLFIAFGAFGLVSLFAVVLLMSLGSKKKPESALAKTDGFQVKETSVVTPAYKNDVDEFNAQRASQAAAQNSTALPVLVPTPQANAPKSAPGTAPFPGGPGPMAPAQQNYQQQQQLLAQQQQQQQARNTYEQNRAGFLQSQLAKLFEQWKTPEPVYTQGDARQKAVAAAPAPSMGTGGVKAVEQPARRLIDAGTELLATSDSVINTGDGVPVFFTVRTPPFTGAKIVGKPVRHDDVVSITTNHMTFNGKTYAMNAVVLDLDTSRGVLSGSIDHKWMQRYGWPFLAATIGKYGSLLAAANSSTTVSSGAVIISTQRPSIRDAISGGVGAGLQQVVQQMRQNGNVEPTITIPKNTPVAVHVMETVMDDGKPVSMSMFQQPAQQHIQAAPEQQPMQQPTMQQSMPPGVFVTGTGYPGAVVTSDIYH